MSRTTRTTTATTNRNCNYELQLRTATTNCNCIRRAWNPSQPLAPARTGSWRETRALSLIGSAESAVLPTATTLDRSVAVRLSFDVLHCQHQGHYTPQHRMSNLATIDFEVPAGELR